MKRILMLLIFILALGATSFGQKAAARDEQKIRDLVGRWDTAYRAMDGEAIAALETPDYELVDRFGNWMAQTSREENARMWNWTFKNIYQGKPGPAHTIERVRFINPQTAVVTCQAFWAEVIKLPDGTSIPPHGQTTTFTVVKTQKGWQIAAQTIHNRMQTDGFGSIPRRELPWNR